MSRDAWSTLGKAHRWAIGVGGGILLVLLFFAVGAPWVAPYGLLEVDPGAALQGPSFSHWLGTDEDGADLLSRLIFGSRVAVIVGFGTVALSVAVGFFVGCVSGYFGGWVDEVLMRFLEILLSFPGILLAIFIIFITQEPSEWTVVLALSVTGWAGYARLVRGQVLTVRENEYVAAAESIGASRMRVMFRHLAPNIMGPVIVQATFGVAGAILAEASLSFLGLGPQGSASWGAVLDQGAVLFIKSPHVGLAAGMAIFMTVMGIHLLGDTLRDILDPQMQE